MTHLLFKNALAENMEHMLDKSFWISKLDILNIFVQNRFTTKTKRLNRHFILIVTPKAHNTHVYSVLLLRLKTYLFHFIPDILTLHILTTLLLTL